MIARRFGAENGMGRLRVFSKMSSPLGVLLEGPLLEEVEVDVGCWRMVIVVSWEVRRECWIKIT